MFERRQRSCWLKYACSVLGTNVLQRACSVIVVRYQAFTICRVRKRSSPYLIGTPRIERFSSTGSSSTSTLRRYAVRQPERHITRRNPHARGVMKKDTDQDFTTVIRRSQFAGGGRTATQPPTAARRAS